jgi:hypothetical protein
MRDSESTLRRARREPAKAERRLRAKNRRGVSERGSETAILATGGKVLPGSRTRFRGAHTRQRWPLCAPICDWGDGGVKRPMLRHNVEEPHTLFRGRLPPASYRENPALTSTTTKLHIRGSWVVLLEGALSRVDFTPADVGPEGRRSTTPSFGYHLIAVTIGYTI